MTLFKWLVFATFVIIALSCLLSIQIWWWTHPGKSEMQVFQHFWFRIVILFLAAIVTQSTLRRKM